MSGSPKAGAGAPERRKRITLERADGGSRGRGAVVSERGIKGLSSDRSGIPFSS
jgi:hypothetical protein